MTDSVNDLAIVNVPDLETTPEYLFVTAYSGLSLREFGNLNSDRLAKMPYGTKVKVITPEKNLTMNVGGIKGGMDEIEFNQKKGFAFNGYLSKFFPPEDDVSPKVYAEELKALFPSVTFSESVGGTASKPTNTETLILPTDHWHEAYFVAQHLFDFPNKYEFPNPKGKDEEIVKDGKKDNTKNLSELLIYRKEDVLQKIKYVYQAERFNYSVTITKKDTEMKIEKIEEIN